MVLEVILNGGLRSCCSTYPTDFVEKILNHWLSDITEIKVLDTKETEWTPEGASALAIETFGDGAYPQIFIDGKLAVVGLMPDMSVLKDMITTGKFKEITEEDVREAARESGKL